MKYNVKALILTTVLIIGSILEAGYTGQVQAATNGIVKEGSDYLLYEDGVFQENFTGLKKIEDDDTFELYYVENGKAVLNSWKTVTDESGKFKYYFGKNGKAYKAESFEGMRSTKVVLKTVKGKKYGFDENGHMAKGLWSTETKLVYFNKKTGVYNKKTSKKYQKAVKRGKTSKKLLKNLKKVFGKPKKTKKTNSCNPFDLEDGEGITGKKLKSYKGYTLTYKNIVISLTKNTKTGVYHMDGAGPIDLD